MSMWHTHTRTPIHFSLSWPCARPLQIVFVNINRQREREKRGRNFSTAPQVVVACVCVLMMLKSSVNCGQVGVAGQPDDEAVKQRGRARETMALT